MKPALRTGWFPSIEKADALASHLFNLGYGTLLVPYGGGAQLSFWRKSK